MKIQKLFIIILLCLPNLLASQTKEELSQILFPEDPIVRELFEQMEGKLTKEKIKRFYKLVEGARKKSQRSKELNDNLLFGDYNGLEIKLRSGSIFPGRLPYDQRSDIHFFSMEGKGVKLFGSSKQSDHIKALKKYPNMLYEYLEEENRLTGFLLPQIKATVLLKYKDGNLIEVTIKKIELYSRYEKVLVRKHLIRAEKECNISAKPFSSLFSPIDFSSYPKKSFLNLEYFDESWMLYGNVLYKGKIENGLPVGKGKWSSIDSCSTYFSFPNSSFIAYGNFNKGRPDGWHKVNFDSFRIKLRYNNGILSEVEDLPVTLPFNGRARLHSKLINGKLSDPDAFYITGKDYKTQIPYFNGEPQPKGQIKYYTKTGQLVTLSIDENKNIKGPFRAESKRDRLDFVGEINEEGNIIADKRILKIGFWGIRNKDLYPQKAEVHGSFEVDLVNSKWGGEDLTITFPGTDLKIKGSFIPAYGYSIYAAPTGIHTLTGRWNGKDVNLKGEYKNGVFVSGDKLYTISSRPVKSPVHLNFDLITNTYILPEDSLSIPIQEAKGIGLERMHDNGKKCKVNVIFKDANGKVVATNYITVTGYLSSKDFTSTLDLKRKSPIKYVVLKRYGCRDYMKVHLYNTKH